MIRRVCPVCGSDDSELWFADVNRRERYPLRGEYVRCRRCGMRYLGHFDDPGPSAAAYERLYELDVAPGKPVPPATLLWRVANGVVVRVSRLFDRSDALHHTDSGRGRGRRVLDVGCSDGARLRLYRAGGWQVAGVDVNSRAVAVARRSEGDFRVGTVQDAGFAEARFDLVRLDNVLEHVERPHELLVSVRRLLVPGGRIAIFVPNGAAWSLAWAKQYSVSSWIPFHVNLFTAGAMRQLLMDTGYDRIAVHHNTPLAWLWLTVKQLVARGRPVRAQLTLVERAASILLGPLAWIANLAGRGEELVVFARRA
ncbi:MAG TPA: class I SAM-dependent methyltransferase [Gemmatimonadales bacterium]|nr:class I SAM-dependent methyltransferase [Gemmatimonadales bacterium]